MTRVLVTYGSKRGGTAEIAAAIAEALHERELAVDCLRASDVRDLSPYDAVVVGGALYMNRWIREARRFVTRNATELARRPVWMFSSGPLDPSAGRGVIPPTPTIAALMARVGARSHTTFGGRLAPDAKGFPASAMAKTRAGDWRDWDRIRCWAFDIAHALIVSPRPLAPAPIRRPQRWPLAALCLVVGITATAGGLGFVIRPDGSLLHMPLSTLSHSPFSSFVIPGWLLLVVIGIGNLVAAAIVARETPIANVVGFAGGAALVTWIIAEMILLRSVLWLQLAYLGIGVAIMAHAVRRRAAERTTTTPGAPVARQL
jgi:menaquinone-dependent protoporphyrinogen oxidase